MAADDVYYPVTISADEAAQGLSIEVDYDAADPCSECDGSGLSIESKKCPRCGTNLEGRRGPTFVLLGCDYCGWKQRTQSHCRSCEGKGSHAKGETLIVKIPAGIVNQARLRVAGKGGVVRGKQVRGDFFVLVTISSKDFERSYRVVDTHESELFSRSTNGRDSRRSPRSTDLSDPFLRLLELAEPMVFRQNPFRILGIPVNSSEREIKKHIEKLQIMARIGDGGYKITGPLSLDPPPDENLIRRAIHDLRDPEKRLIYEVLWLWPISPTNDPAIDELSHYRIQPAIEIWERLESEEGGNPIAQHNLAILFHAAAFDLEYAGQYNQLSAEAKKTQEFYFHQGFLRWKSIIEDDKFWGLVNTRVRELDEPQLTTGTVRRFQLTLPAALVSLNARLAVSAAEKGDRDELIRQRRLMNESGLGIDAIEVALSRALSPMRLRITKLCQEAESQVSGNEENGSRIVRGLLEEAKPLLLTLDELLPAGNQLRDEARDVVAQTALNCQIPYGNKTQNWEECVELLEMTKPFPVSASIKSRIQQNLAVVKENFRLKTLITCWFCKKNECDEKAMLSVDMYGDVKRYSTGYNKTRVEWRTATVRVPRCGECQLTHKRTNRFLLAGAFLGLLGGIAICFLAWLVAGVNDQTANEAIVFATGFIIVAMLLLGLDMGDQLAKCSSPEGIIHRSRSIAGFSLTPAKGYPGLEDMKSKGWIVGKRPSS